VHRLISGRHTVGFKRVWMLGVSEERIRCDTSRTSNDADGPQYARRSRLENRSNRRRRYASHL
jgi:hypothetical protein